PAPIEDRMPMAGELPGGDPTGSVAGSSPDPYTTDPVQTDTDLAVHVAGAVAEPGVVELSPGSRVEDAMSAVGGPAEGADLGRLNLAAPLVDGARLYVPAIGEQVPPELAMEVPASSGSSSPGDTASRVDINSADGPALEELPGVGPATASAIIEHRERNGRFDSVEDLLAVRGIGEAKLAAMADLVAVG
ncbi:MAG: helix-hairpin-helix domain-containing protein, partial [Microthrixaceae bacterium]